MCSGMSFPSNVFLNNIESAKQSLLSQSGYFKCVQVCAFLQMCPANLSEGMDLLAYYIVCFNRCHMPLMCTIHAFLLGCGNQN
jgi:hypothetical protein